jgi:hypothetical protein
LQSIKGRPSGFIKRDDFTVQNGLVGHGSKSLGYVWIAGVEVIVIAGTKLDSAGCLDGNGPVAVEFEFVEPIAAVRQLLLPQQKHGLNEAGFHFKYLAPKSTLDGWQ